MLDFILVAEFIIDIADKNPDYDSFNSALQKNGADLPGSFVSNLQRLIHHMRPPKPKKSSLGAKVKKSKSVKVEKRREKYPGLCIPDEKMVITQHIKGCIGGLLSLGDIDLFYSRYIANNISRYSI